MRLKLVFIASLIASVVGAGAAIAIVLFVFSSLESMKSPGLLVAATWLLPLLTIFYAAMFVYRHTARRRRLQAALTVLVSLVLTLTIFVVASILTARSNPQPPQQLQQNVG
jgi:glucan phosphoethanolaminetransferase (alkaline phosphatase superfamily)